MQKMTELADRGAGVLHLRRAGQGQKAEAEKPGSTVLHWRHTREVAVETVMAAVKST
jgi:hypothetical protein